MCDKGKGAILNWNVGSSPFTKLLSPYIDIPLSL